METAAPGEMNWGDLGLVYIQLALANLRETHCSYQFRKSREYILFARDSKKVKEIMTTK
jgi:hypothetical protein